MVSEDHTFEAAGAGASLVYPMQAGALRKGGHVMLKGHPCKISEISISKTGKHGHAKAHIVGNDIFTDKKYEDLCPSSHNMEVPNVKKEEYTVIDIDTNDNTVSLLTEGGDTKDDLNLPCEGLSSTPDKVAEDLIKAFEDGKTCIVCVQCAMDQEKIISFKESNA